MEEGEEEDEEEEEEEGTSQTEFVKRKDEEYRHLLYPISWKNPPLADPKSVQRSKDELFEEEADLSDQMSKLSNIVKRQMKQQKWDRESSAKTIIQAIEKMFLDRAKLDEVVIPLLKQSTGGSNVVVGGGGGADEMSHGVKEE